MIPNIYEGNYKRLVILPIALIVLAIFFIPSIRQGVDFKGGVLITLQTDQPIDSIALEQTLKEKFGEGTTVKQFETAIGNSVEITLPQDERLARTETLKAGFFSIVDDVSRLEADVAILDSGQNISGYGIDPSTRQKYLQERSRLNAISNELFSLAGQQARAENANSTNELRKSVSTAYNSINSAYQSDIRSTLESTVPYSSISFEVVSSTLSDRFLSTAMWVVAVSSILAIAVVFFVFRTFVPSAAVLIGAAADVTIAMGAMGFFGIPLTLASFAALLMLIGFSLDTDILLTMRTLKGTEGHPRQRAYDSFKTGATMSLAAIAAFSSLFVLSSLTNISTYYEISAVALAGLVGDLFATWGLNGVIILWHAEQKEKEAEAMKSTFVSVYQRKK